jgi:phosphatidylethanolamine-binding protein (PEBP) family uncharacterized protein
MAAVGRLLRGLRAGVDHDRFQVAAPVAGLAISSPTFADGAAIPPACAGKGLGDNMSPCLEWSGVPPGAQALVLVMDDIDVPLRRPLVHTVALIETGVTGLGPGGLVPGTPGLQFLPGTLRNLGYAGPRPIPGHGPHRYRFRLFALNAEVPHPTTSKALPGFVASHTIAYGVWTGTYER